MPIYEYVCEACGRLTEVMQKVSDPPPGACPGCGEARLSKLVSRTSFQLKGGGWYSDLYASAGAGKAKPKAEAAPSPPGGGADAKPSPAPATGGTGGEKK
ncbi:MAG: zinc ribbon domain-containing protein [Anaeromyxobacteraceae bacterium]